VLARGHGAEPPPEVGGFHSFRVIEVDRVENRGAAAAHGVLQARAPFVGTSENHAFPEADALERILESFDDAVAGVAPVMRSANPETARSLAMYLVAYGHAGAPGDAEPRDSLPYHNAVYRTGLLQAFEDELPDLMGAEWRLQAELRAAGHELRLCPGAVSWHVNEARWSRSVKDPFVLGLLFGQRRSREWPRRRRWAYALAAPAIALMRLGNLRRLGRQLLDTRERLGRITPMLALTSVMGGLGEAAGYLRPHMPPTDDFEEHEFHIRGRLAGVLPDAEWLGDRLALLPEDTL
jgi:hypothetical protein